MRLLIRFFRIDGSQECRVVVTRGGTLPGTVCVRYTPPSSLEYIGRATAYYNLSIIPISALRVQVVHTSTHHPNYPAHEVIAVTSTRNTLHAVASKIDHQNFHSYTGAGATICQVLHRSMSANNLKDPNASMGTAASPNTSNLSYKSSRLAHTQR